MSRTAIIIEDEVLSADRLHKLVSAHSDILVLGKLDSVEASMAWLQSNELPDLIFLDIQLSDGTGLDILNGIEDFPSVIFTTAFDQYMLEAFKFNSVDYLLKPIKQDELIRAIGKFDRLDKENNIPKLLKQLKKGEPTFRSKFLIKVGQKFHSIITESIAYFQSEDGTTFIVTKEGQRLIVDKSLDQMEPELDPKSFFRINRQMIVGFSSISSIDAFFNNRLILEVTPKCENQVLVSRDKVKPFKAWLDA